MGQYGAIIAIRKALIIPIQMFLGGGEAVISCRVSQADGRWLTPCVSSFSFCVFANGCCVPRGQFS